MHCVECNAPFNPEKFYKYGSGHYKKVCKVCANIIKRENRNCCLPKKVPQTAIIIANESDIIHDFTIGESFSSIAKKYGVRISSLRKYLVKKGIF